MPKNNPLHPPKQRAHPWKRMHNAQAKARIAEQKAEAKAAKKADDRQWLDLAQNG